MDSDINKIKLLIDEFFQYEEHKDINAMHNKKIIYTLNEVDSKDLEINIMVVFIGWRGLFKKNAAKSHKVKIHITENHIVKVDLFISDRFLTKEIITNNLKKRVLAICKNHVSESEQMDLLKSINLQRNASAWTISLDTTRLHQHIFIVLLFSTLLVHLAFLRKETK
jgi:hypothetical protein